MKKLLIPYILVAICLFADYACDHATASMRQPTDQVPQPTGNLRDSLDEYVIDLDDQPNPLGFNDSLGIPEDLASVHDIYETPDTMLAQRDGHIIHIWFKPH